MKRIVATLLILALALGSGGCGSGGGESASGAAAGGDDASPAHYPADPDLRRQLANAFDAGLYRLAVMSQPRDSATDLGQSLPTGLLRSIACGRPGAPQGPERTEIARCRVVWQTVAGAPRKTRYVVRLFPTGCFAAGATPRLPQHRDQTIQTFSEHPLNALVSVTRHMRALLGACALLLAAALLTGCGGGERPQESAVANPPAAPLEDLVRVSGNIPRVRTADFVRPTAKYRRYVLSQLGPMQGAIERLRGEVAAGDLAAARRAWLAADERYESIGAAYGAFGELDARINGGAGGLRGGVDSPEFTGLHRIELALWGRDSAAEAAPYVERLGRDVAALRRTVPTIEIEPLEYVLRSHEVLEGTLDLQLSGRESPWSGSALRALRGNLRGTEVVLGTLYALIKRRSPVVAQRSEASLAALRKALKGIETDDGSLPRWDKAPERVRTEIAGLTAAAAEQLAYVPEVVDPRPPLAPKSAIGTVAAK